MHKHVMRLLLSSALLTVALPAAAQKVVIESQGQAEIVARAQALDARGVADAIGQAPEDKGQIVFYRASASPGAAIGVQEGETALIDLGFAMGPIIASVHQKREDLQTAIKAAAKLEAAPRLRRYRIDEVSDAD